MFDSKGVFSDILTKLNNIGRRVTTLETIEYMRTVVIQGNGYLINTTINAGVVYDSGDLRGVQGVGINARGFLGNIWITPLDTSTDLYISAGDDSPNIFSQRYRWLGAADSNRQHMSQFIFGQFGPDGNIKIQAVGSNTEVFIVAFAYWL